MTRIILTSSFILLLATSCSSPVTGAAGGADAEGNSDSSSAPGTTDGEGVVTTGAGAATGMTVTGDGDGASGDGDGVVSGDGDGDGDGDSVVGDGDGDQPVHTGPIVDPRGTRNCDTSIIHLGEIHLFTNEWTDPEANTCVFLDNDGTFGIEWTRGATGAGDNPSYPNYPEAEFGINPWNASGEDRSTTQLLPLQLKDFTSASMTLDVHMTTQTNSGWNLAFELWLSDTDPTLGPAQPKGEIMVFLGNEPGYWPPTPVGGTFHDGHNQYTLYESSDTWGDWGIYRQWRLGDTDGVVDFNGTLDIYAFLKHHMENEGWDKNLWVTRFEIGNETFQNSGGTTRFRSLCFEVNGTTKCAQTE